MRIFHLVAPAVWAGTALQYRPVSLTVEGFVHFSFADQVAGTANLRYRDEPELIVLEVESDDLDAELRVEDSYGSGTAFPHVYGPIPVAAVLASHPLRRTATGDWTFTPDAEAGAASTDR